MRNLPEVSKENPGPLLHNLEADLVSNTGGNLALVPPILRKYWSQFLQKGSFSSWYEAVAWYKGLGPADRDLINKYLGFEHLDLRQYQSLRASLGGSGPGIIVEASRRLVEQEERQRLFDFTEQFDLLLGQAQREENFQFWRGHLRDKLALHRTHTDYLASLHLPRAPDLASALSFLTALRELSPKERALRIAAQLQQQPFLVNFLPALSNRILVELFASGATLPEGTILRATASFVDQLDRFNKVVDGVLAAGRERPQKGAAALRQFLGELPLEQVEDLRLFFELLRDTDPVTSSQVVETLDKETVRSLMKPAPFQLRTLLTPEQLLTKLDITTKASTGNLRDGLDILLKHPSGNFIVDEPFFSRMFEIIAARGKANPERTLLAFQETPFPLGKFIQEQPGSAVALLSADLKTAVQLVRDSDPLLFAPPRVIYRLIYADAEFAARLTVALDEAGETKLVEESLAHFAYDQQRLEQIPGLPISLEADGRFLEGLLRQQGEEWLTQRLSTTFTTLGSRVAQGDLGPDFLSQYRATLEAAVASVPPGESQSRLRAILAGF